ncbi:MAG: tRNA uridine(34) 5-carboxymethylaminomethyl modification radical SAM/GNAT enzyme Elp3 [Coriobacteriales bacterium]|nr:tRNA uridine(34) 5-carboxymethylaminomethyl modification radical SAM/GNAT enzyme Elp3 [Coriobacteriales bacterium]
MNTFPSEQELEALLLDILKSIRDHGVLDGDVLDHLISKHNKEHHVPYKYFTKKQLAPFYFVIKQHEPMRWQAWNIDSTLERNLLASIQLKPRRTASGVATITVITKPYPCCGSCIYCPNDIRMPKSYMHDEPACQRAEYNFFDPFLQVARRLNTLNVMGHATDKIELIVLGGTFLDYPSSYQTWFITELFKALNNADQTNFTELVKERERLYVQAGILREDEAIRQQTACLQERVNKKELTYNEAHSMLYGEKTAWESIASWQAATLDQLEQEHHRNENAAHRVVGLVVEIRPATVNAQSLTFLRQLGCTKLQMGVQTLNQSISDACHRPTTPHMLEQAFELARAFGFKSHAHFMVNLPGSTPGLDEKDFEAFVTNPVIAPDEIKLYPCVLLGGTGLEELFRTGAWQPYEEDTLIDVLAHDVLATPQHARISRMIRDFSAPSILAGSRKTNLRQPIEERVYELANELQIPVKEIRMREIATDTAQAEDLSLDEEMYTTSNTREFFLQWITPQNQIAGFLRLSLPDPHWIEAHKTELPVKPYEAMIREVHVYGTAAKLHAPTHGAQHQGLGKALVHYAEELAKSYGYTRINVISAIGTRGYYRSLGFEDNGLYQTIDL